MKRLIDVVVGSVAAVVTLPLVVILALMASVTFRASPVFVQIRIGRDNRPFRFLKLRSLHRDHDPQATKYDLVQSDMTRFGRALRRSHLDELPQIWLVVFGSMSLVGPRPEMPNLQARFSVEQLEARGPFRPGITGLWQISDHAGGLMFETPEYDSFYAKLHSLRLDLWILWRTVLMKLGRGTITLDTVPGWAVADRGSD